MPNTSPTPSLPGRWIIPSFGPPSVLKWTPFPSGALPQTGPNEALIRILIAGVSGADNIMRAGGYTRDPRTAAPGFTPGYDLVGVVEAIGNSGSPRRDEQPEGESIQVGDTIASLSVIGAHATHTVLPLGDLIKVDAHDDLVKVAVLPLNYMTALGMLTRSAFPVTASTSSILIGSVAGGVGTAVAQVARLLFPGVKMFGTCSAGKFDMVRRLGVEPIDRRIEPGELAAAVRRLNGGEGVDVAYEATGSEANLQASLAATKTDGGKVIAIGFMGNIKPDGSGMQPQDKLFDPATFVEGNKERVAWFSVTGSYWMGAREAFRRDFEGVLLRAVREGALDPHVGGVWRLEEKVAVDGMVATGDVRGKMVYVVDGELWDGLGGRGR